MRTFLVLLALMATWIAASPASACDLPVCTAPSAQDLPLAVSDGAGGAIVVWQDWRISANERDLYAQHVLANLTVDPAWPVNGVPIVQAPDTQGDQDITSDGAGGAFIVWTDLRAFSTTREDVYAQHVLANGTIAPGWPANGLPVRTAPGTQWKAKVVSDGAGGAFVVWEDNPPGGEVDIYGSHLLADGSLAPGWAVNGTPICSELYGQYDPAPVADGAGGVIVAWWDRRNASVSDIDVYAQRMTGQGTVAAGWPVGGKQLTAAPGYQGGEVRAVSDGAGGAVVAWRDGRWSPDGDIYAQRVTAAGALAAGWAADGQYVCVSILNQENIRMISDGSGGALLCWDDYRDRATTGEGLFGQHILGNGTIAPGWPTNCLRLTGGPGLQYRSSPVPDGIGGMLVALVREDTFAGEDVLVQHVLGYGLFAPGWPAQGKVLCGGTATDKEAAAVADGAGGMIVFMTHGGNSSDIYASRVPPEGVVATLVALTSAEAEPDRVTLSWFGDEAAGMPASVERRTANTDWARLADIVGDGSGTLRYVDETVTPGASYAYRLSYASGTETAFTSETWVDVPKPVFALDGLRPNPAVGGDCVVSFSLFENAPAVLEIFDVAGRRMISRDVGGLGVGRRQLRLDEGARLAPGIYTLRLTQAGRTLTTRGTVLR